MLRGKKIIEFHRKLLSNTKLQYFSLSRHWAVSEREVLTLHHDLIREL